MRPSKKEEETGQWPAQTADEAAGCYTDIPPLQIAASCWDFLIQNLIVPCFLRYSVLD